MSLVTTIKVPSLVLPINNVIDNSNMQFRYDFAAEGGYLLDKSQYSRTIDVSKDNDVSNSGDTFVLNGSQTHYENGADTPTGSFTCVVVFNTTDSVAPTGTIISSRTEENVGLMFWLASTGNIRTSVAGTGEASTSAGTYNDGNYHYAVFIYDHADSSITLKLPKSGVTEVYTSKVLDNTGGREQLALFAEERSGTTGYEGQLAHLSLYDGVVLNNTQINALYKRTKDSLAAKGISI